MAIPCPKCTVSAAIGIEGEFVFFGGQCIELSGTRYVNRFEWCPILSEAIAQEVRKPHHRPLRLSHHQDEEGKGAASGDTV